MNESGVPEYVVRLTGTSSDGRTFNGTGFFVSRHGLIATCRHVAMPGGESPRELWIEFGLHRRWKCEVLKQKPSEDLVILTAVVPMGEDTPFARMDIEWRKTTAVGDEVSLWGHSGAAHFSSPQRFVCRISGFVGEFARIGLDGTINAGDSGAPVVNSRGLVVGVTQVKDRANEGQAMAIPVSFLFDLVPDAVFANPYRGLEFFDVEHSAFFFGREPLIEELLSKLKGSRFLGLVGPVGSGKSSLARAGLLAAIQRGALPGSERWRVAVCRPGADPLESLAIALAKANRSELTPAAIRAQVQELGASDRTLHLSSRLALADLPAEQRVIVLVNQFEELFTQCADEKARQAFIDNLITAATDSDGQTIILLTLRADFYGECASHPRLAAILSAQQVLVGPMQEPDLQRAIEAPAARAGAEFEPGLVGLLLDEVRGQPGSLPLLQYSLSELWPKPEEGNRLTLGKYQAIGRVGGAVERRAEDVYTRFSDPEQHALRRIMLRLVQRTDDGKATRRRARSEDLLPAEGDRAIVDKVVQRMASASVRLFTIDTPVHGATPGDSHLCVEIAHEALIRSWKRLGEWLNQDREFQLWQRHLTASLGEWEQSGRHSDALLRGKLLTEARGWLETRRGELNLAEKDFIQAGMQTDKARAEKEARADRAFRMLALILGLLFIAAAAAAVYARHESRIANSLALAAVSEESARNPELALILSMHAVSRADNSESEEALYRAVRAAEGKGFPASSDGALVLGMAYDPTRHLLATANSNDTIALWETATTGIPPRILRFDGDGVANVSFLPRENAMAVATSHGIKIVGLAGNQPAIQLRANAEVNAAEFNAAGKTLAIATKDAGSPLALWNYPNGPLRTLPGQTGPVAAVRFTPDNRYLISADISGAVFVWDAGSGQQIATFRTSDARQLISLAASPAGGMIAAGDTAGSIDLWEVPSGQVIGRVLHSEHQHVRGLSFSSDGRTMASASQDGTVRLWNVSGRKITERTSIVCGKPLAAEKTDREGCTALLFTSAHTLYAADRDGDVRQYETDIRMLQAQARGLIDLPHVRPETTEGCRKYLHMASCKLP